MPIPSPNFRRKPYQQQAVQEIVSSLVAGFGVLLQLGQTIATGRKPSEAQRLALALYGPDHDAKLTKLASELTGSFSLSILGAVLTILGLVGVLWFKYMKARDLDRKEDQISNPEGLRGCAHVLYAQLKFKLGVLRDDGEIRVTVHRVTEDRDPNLEQVIDHVGVSKPTGKGRRFSIRTGVIGFAARTGQPKLAERSEGSSEEEYKKELVDQWGYTKEEAEHVSLDHRGPYRRSVR